MCAKDEIKIIAVQFYNIYMINKFALCNIQETDSMNAWPGDIL